MRFLRGAVKLIENRFRRISAPIVASVSIILLYGIAIITTYSNEVDTLVTYRGERSSAITDPALDVMWNDLQNISAQPHSYNSRAHERVRIFVLDRLRQITVGVPDTSFAEIVEDNDSFVITLSEQQDENRAKYFEGQNIYAVIHGNKDGNPGVLVSAHYDSVSTSFGTTDDGISIVVMLFLFEHFLSQRPDSTIVFNFNTGEELGLLGAKQFLKHPLSKEVKYFLNIDSAGAAGRSTMHRASNYEVLKAFAGVHHGLGSVIMQDVFRTGVMKSMTDFSIYDDANLKGLDMAYYKSRSRYHTPLDNMRSTNRGSVRYLAQSSLRTVSKLSSSSTKNVTSDNAHVTGVFFDYLGISVIALSMNTFIAISLIAVIIGPLVLGGLLYFLIFKEKIPILGRKGWLRVPGTLVILVLVNYLLLRIISAHNRDVIYSSDIPILTIFSVSAVAVAIFLYVCDIVSPELHSLNSLLELTVLYWILSLVGVIYQIKMRLGGSYIFIIQYVGSLLACGLAIVPYTKGIDIKTHHIDSIQLTDQYDSREHGNEDDEIDDGTASDSPLEHVPLLPAVTSDENSRATISTISDQAIESLIECAQFIFICLIPGVIFLQLGFFSVYSLRHTATDGSPYILPYAAISFATTAILLPMTPFICRMLRTGRVFSLQVNIVLAVAVCGAFVATLTKFPFSEQYPMKMFYEQVVDLSAAPSDNSTLFSGYVTLTGIPSYIPTVIAEMPSAKGIVTSCSSSPMRRTLSACSYPGLSPANYVASGSPTEWIDIFMEEDLTPRTYIISIYGKNTRAFELIIPKEVYMSSESTLQFDIIQSPAGTNYTSWEHLPSISGHFYAIDLWTRCNLSGGNCDGSVPFVVRVSNPSGSQINYEALQNIQAACNYDEWIPRSGPDFPDENDYKEIGRIPALDELFHYMPSWATFLKRTNSLVKVIKGLEVKRSVN
ncbi:hypothetical protein V1525DRAFT_458310 [Lipomyces kononenkoae]|uniref:Uncharacterized protein n=1 Tax=Lipomyces kononenkoae TaxID=34357 RepID=A0ACC3SVM1_LIPKO